ncbi:MAG: transketolase [Phycisphaerae bacterium]|nr:transketolase [Phycisphaerae bacterium]
MSEYKDLDRKIIKLAKQSVRMCTEAGTGHPSSSLALSHIVTALMYRVMRYDPKNPWNLGADRLVLSEGHAVPIVYAAYCDLGGIVGLPSQPSELRFSDALTLRAADSVLDGHPNPAIGMPFFDAATGSLGQGLSVAAGLALAARLDGSDRQFFCIMGDGEAREGQVAEALDFVVDNKLMNVRAIFNCNGQGQSGLVSEQQSAETMEKKLIAYGYDVKVIDGHNWDEVFAALTAAPTDKPIAIVAKTIKGWGVECLQGTTSHGKAVSSAELDAALAELDSKAGQLGVAEVADVDARDLKEPLPVSRPNGGDISAGSFADALKTAGLEAALEKGKISTRCAWGVAMGAIGADKRVVSLDAEVKGSTFANIFEKQHADRFVECKIAEQNMISAAVGMAAGGRIPFTSSFAKFFVRAYDQIEMAAISGANVKIVGSHAGVSLAADGPSQMGLCDLAFMRAFAHAKRVDGQPLIRVFQPADGMAAFKLTEMMANLDGMCYMRTHRPDVDFIYDENEEFSLDGFKHLIDGEDIAIVASGYMVGVAKQAVELLEQQAGLSASLIDAYAMPLATDEIMQIGDDNRGQILVIEDNYVGGFGDELTAAAAVSDLGVVVKTINAGFAPKSTRSPEETLKMLSLTAKNVADVAQKMFDQSEA